MLGLEIQINNDTPVTVAAENFSFVLLDTAMRQDDTGYIYAHGLDYSNSYHWISVVPRQGDKGKSKSWKAQTHLPCKTENRTVKRCWHATNNLKRNWKKKV